MSLLLDRDNPPRRGKLRQHLAERGANGREIAVQQHQRPTATVYLVVHLQTVHGNIATLDERARMILCCHVYSYSFCYSLMRMCWHHFFLGLGASRNAVMIGGSSLRGRTVLGPVSADASLPQLTDGLPSA